MSPERSRAVLVAGVVGLVGALVAALSELALHYSASGYAQPQPYAFFADTPRWRLAWGHFGSVLSVPLYFVGYWHLCERLKPARRGLRLAVLALGLYGFALGGMWLASRVYLALIAQARAATQPGALDVLLSDAAFFNETILIGVRAAVLGISALYVFLVATGRTGYPRWMAWLNPIFLVALCFGLYVVAPRIGGFVMPAAMNVAHVVFFAVSIALLAVRPRPEAR